MSHKIVNPKYTVLHWEWPTTGPLALSDVKKKELESRLPDPDVKLSFYMEQTDKKLMNALRSVIDTNKLPRPALSVEMEDIYHGKDYDYFIPDEFRARIGLICLHPDTPIDAIWKIEVTNTTKSPMVIYSKHLEQIKGLKKSYFDDGFRIMTLETGKTLRVGKISVIVGSGDQHGRFVGTSQWKFREVDYVSGDLINHMGRTVPTVFKSEDLHELYKKGKPIGGKSSTKPPADLSRTQWLIVPDKELLVKAPESMRPKFDLYDYVYESEVKNYHTYNYNPTHYYMSVRTSNGYHPALLMRDAADCLVRRLNQILNLLDKKNEQAEFLASNIQVTKEGEKTLFTIRDENEVISHLIWYGIMRLDPNIKYAAPRVEHVLKDVAIVVVTHPEPEKIFKQSCEDYIKVLKKLSGEFADLVALPDSSKLAAPQQTAKPKKLNVKK